MRILHCAMSRRRKKESRAAQSQSVARLERNPTRKLSRHIAVVWGVLLAAVTIVAYEPAWHAGFIWDDDIYVTQNKLLVAPDGLRRIWFSLVSTSQFFPLVYTTFRLEYALW